MGSNCWANRLCPRSIGSWHLTRVPSEGHFIARNGNLILLTFARTTLTLNMTRKWKNNECKNSPKAVFYLAIPCLFFSRLFNTISELLIANKNCWWLDLYPGYLVLESTALPIAPQPLTQTQKLLDHVFVFKTLHRCTLLELMRLLQLEFLCPIKWKFHFVVGLYRTRVYLPMLQKGKQVQNLKAGWLIYCNHDYNGYISLVIQFDHLNCYNEFLICSFTKMTGFELRSSLSNALYPLRNYNRNVLSRTVECKGS